MISHQSTVNAFSPDPALPEDLGFDGVSPSPSAPRLCPKSGRGADWNPKNRFEKLEYTPEPVDSLDPLEVPRPVLTQFFRDGSQSILTRNQSPDVGFEVSLNPYRGCEHGCAYCYARPTHEYLGWSSGLDFESRILVKEDAPELLRKALGSKRWKPEPIFLSSVTDCYQPIERRLLLTRRCLAVLAEFRNPVSMITKNHLITRDVDLLAELAQDGAASASISITTLDPELARVLEPRASPPGRRLAAVEELARAGVPVRVMVAPVIPGLTDHELPSIVAAAALAGASEACYVPIRLPWAVTDIFEHWLEAHYPGHKAKILERIRDLRGGRLDDPNFGSRMRGQGIYADTMRRMFTVAVRKAGLERGMEPLSSDAFRVPGEQLRLF
jgi:DNA repair photolyase